jgi:hypothetical protein
MLHIGFVIDEDDLPEKSIMSRKDFEYKVIRILYALFHESIVKGSVQFDKIPDKTTMKQFKEGSIRPETLPYIDDLPF